MIPNLLTLALVAFVPLVLGYIWFSESLFGGERWIQIAGINRELANKEVPLMKVIATMIPNFLIAFGLYNLIVHGSGVFGLVGGDTELLKTGTAASFLQEYGSNYLTIKHGIFHGILPGYICFVLPVLLYVVIFERKSAKYFWVYSGYWILSLAIMGAIISKWGWTLV